MKIKIEGFELFIRTLHTRLPFKYGIATMTRVPQLVMRMQVVIDGKTWTGISADLLALKWFTKDPDRDVQEEIEEMIAVVRHAGQAALGVEGESAFSVWREVYGAQRAWGDGQKLAPLLSSFGTTFVERALLEAICRAASTPFHQMVREDRLGLNLGEIHPELANFHARDFLPAEPLDRPFLRQTIGLADPLTAADIAPGEVLDDGLPQSLVDNIRHYGLRHFKVKVHGSMERDLDRLERIAAILSEEAAPDFVFSFDANEQFRSLEDFRRYWDETQRHPALRKFFAHLYFVEQPLHRDVALQAGLQQAFNDWPDRPPILIDESDASLESARVAMDLGYAGGSYKSCKGVFKGLANRCLIAQRQREEPGRTRMMSGEDLTNVGPVSTLQDFAVMAALGIESMERNGHHFFPGLSMYDAETQRETLAWHGDLFVPTALGWPSLKIEDGRVDLESVNRSPFGVGLEFRAEQFERI